MLTFKGLLLFLTGNVLFAGEHSNASFEHYYANHAAYENSTELDMNHYAGMQWMFQNPLEFNTSPMPLTSNFLQNIIHLYEADKDYMKQRCQFSPSCSRYSYFALAEYGYLAGTVLTVDRLCRCNETAHLHGYAHLERFLYDPLIKLEMSSSIGQKAAKPVHKNDFIQWLLESGEYQKAYDLLLEREFRNPSDSNRLLLGKTALAMNNSMSTRKWLDGVNIADASFVSSLASYRTGFFGEARKTLRKELTDSYDKATAVLFLHAFLESPDPNDKEYCKQLLNKMFNTGNRHIITEKFEDYVYDPGGSTFSLIQSIFVPGLGQAVNGYFEDGVLPFLLCTGLAYLTASNIDRKDYGDAAFFGTGFLLAYSSNLYSAYRAPMYRRQKEIYNLHLELNKHFDPYSGYKP